MKTYIMIILAGFSALSAIAQEEGSVDSKTTKDLTRQQRIEQRRVDEEAMAKLVDLMINQRQFVLEANYVSNKTGARVIVNSRINFIAVDSSRITIQLASVSGIGGYNGMGGITADGTISRWDISKTGRTKTGYLIRLYTMTRIGSYDIFFTITPSGNADARISGNSSGKTNYYGRLVPLKQSKVFKGMSI
jgi:hypothetical protein